MEVEDCNKDPCVRLFFAGCFLLLPREKEKSDTQANSVYVSVLKIPTVHADSVSKLLRQKFFFSREGPLLARGKILYFATIMDTNRESAHQSQNEANFATLSLGLEFLHEAEKEKNNGKGHSASFCLIFRLPRKITSDIVVRFSRRI